jgi:hypothetical protein
MLSTMRAGLKRGLEEGSTERVVDDECRLMRERRDAVFARFAPLPQ